MAEKGESGYYDILVVGKTGQGKSTTANKLLGIDEATKAYQSESEFFTAGEGVHAVTTECKVLQCKSSRVRVLDTPGFADTRQTQEHGVYESNLQIFRWILNQQKTKNMQFSRVLYFLPVRGVPERADGNLQEEIKVMYEFFGKDIFDIMVIVTTLNKQPKYQRLGFDDDEFEASEKTFKAAYDAIVGKSLPICPPILFLSVNEDKVLPRVKAASVISDDKTLSSKSDAEMTEIAEVTAKKGKRFKLQNICSRCGKKTLRDVLPSGKEIRKVYCADGIKRNDYETECHTKIIPQNSVVKKVLGGIAHVGTLGTALLYGKLKKKKTWPGFTNSDEMCVTCQAPPGTKGCTFVGQCKVVAGEIVLVSHSTNIDEVVIDDE